MIHDICIIFVENSNGEMHVHQRKDDKKIFPSLYGIGAGGKIDQGETPTAAAKKELKEELGISSNIKELFVFPFRRSGENQTYRVYVFRTTCDKKLVPCKREFQWSGWMKIPEIDQLASGNKLCPDTKIAYERYKAENF